MPIDIGQVFHIVIMLTILGLLIWLGVTIKDWYSNPGDRPTWFVSILNVFSPVKYQRLNAMGPYMTSNVSSTPDSSPTANACASNCSVSYGCNGFVWNNTTSNCTQIKSDFGTLVMIPQDSNSPVSMDTYIKTSANMPKWGFMLMTPGLDYAFASNLVSQELGTVYSSNNSTLMANTCIQNASSNCVGFSINTNTINTWLVNSTANTATTANVMSYSYGILPTTSFVDAGF